MENSSLDHKQPRSRNGNNTQGNIVLACLDCNNEKDDMTYEEFKGM